MGASAKNSVCNTFVSLPSSRERSASVTIVKPQHSTAAASKVYCIVYEMQVAGTGKACTEKSVNEGIWSELA